MNKFFNLGSHRSQASSFKTKLAACPPMRVNNLKLAAQRKLAAQKRLVACSLWLAAILILTAASCTKEEPRHRDIVTATINGNPWKAGCKESPPFGCSAADLQYYTDTGGFEFAASNAERDTGIRVSLFEVFVPGVYKMRNNEQCGIIVKEDPCGRQGHYIDENDPQEIEIVRIDNEKKIIEGRFHFIGKDTNCLSDPVHITNGYFKVKYRP